MRERPIEIPVPLPGPPEDTVIVSEDALDVAHSAQDMERAIKGLGSEDATLEDLAAVAREGRRIAERVGREAEDGPAPPADR